MRNDVRQLEAQLRASGLSRRAAKAAVADFRRRRDETPAANDHIAGLLRVLRIRPAMAEA
jgi:hypothetical protein